MRLRIFLLVLLFVIIILPLPMHGDDGDCTGAPSIRLAVGVTARVAFRDGSGAVVREYPGGRFRHVTTLPEGAVLHVVTGPTCSENAQWWRINTAAGVDGWIDEGDLTSYQLEPWHLVLDMPQRTETGVEMVRYNADDASKQITTSFSLKPIVGSAADLFPGSEVKPLDALLKDDLSRCPDVLQSADPALATVTSIHDLPADTGLLDVYPAPDHTALLVVHHLWRSLVDCGAKPSTPYGLDRLTLVTPDGEKSLFDLPANAPAPSYHDKYSRLDGPRAAIVNVAWSADRAHFSMLLQYGDDHDPAIRLYRVVVYDMATGAFTDLGDGIHPAWDMTQNRIQWFRLVGADTGATAKQLLYSANPDGSDLRSIPLPDHTAFLEDALSSPFPLWNPAGTEIVGCTQPDNGCRAIAVYNLTNRQLTNPIPLPAGITGITIRWLNDSALMWVSETGNLVVQPISGETAQEIPLPAEAQITPFPDGNTLLITLPDGTAQVLDVKAEKTIVGSP